jgi:predicted secreted acid phosphatase
MELRIFAIILAAILPGCTVCEPQPNLAIYKEKLTAWHDSGGYRSCFARAAKPAMATLREEIASRRPGERIAIVLDIDETALSNWGYLTSVGFNVQLETFYPWAEKHNDPALEPTLALFREARSARVPVFFITGRKETLRLFTVRQLRAAGYEGWAGLFMAPVSYDLPSVVPFKSGVRKKLAGEGWKIVVNMGDQWSDLEGGYAVKAVKLPNPYYFIR